MKTVVSITRRNPPRSIQISDYFAAPTMRLIHVMPILISLCGFSSSPTAATANTVHNDQLQRFMLEMNDLVYGQMREKLATPHDRDRQIEELAVKAGRLVGTVKAIIGILPGLNLNSENQAVFKGLANQLHIDAQRLETLARTKQIQEIPATLEQMSQTCGACHGLFRTDPGLRERCRDPRHTC